MLTNYTKAFDYKSPDLPPQTVKGESDQGAVSSLQSQSKNLPFALIISNMFDI